MPADLSALAGRTFDAILFDLDGTLVDSVPAVERSWRQWVLEHDVPDEAGFRVPHGIPARQVVAQLLPAEQVEPAVARLVRIELEDDGGIAGRPGAAAALAALGDARAAIVTSATGELAALRFRASGLARPARVVTADDVVHGKPDPEPFRRGAEALGADPGRCLVVEDAPAGLAAARAAGCATLAVLGTHAADELDADAVVPDLSHVRFAVGPDGVRLTAASAAS
ncbi:HAD-IA family hydrolase [Cellulomonas sp. PhB143]|uniref:HAD-IA family hydrolase n=1 Tax=Cellulomonas sp. PhB143 TaxID=2485186 RepID=UPI000F4AE8BC|nr:HAD-IA family hydrolase [Cellulomonas sp. PhB143]ROS76614.1 sugar-phosphatase [Cellulomonas sp. PhB143]